MRGTAPLAARDVHCWVQDLEGAARCKAGVDASLHVGGGDGIGWDRRSLRRNVISHIVATITAGAAVDTALVIVRELRHN